MTNESPRQDAPCTKPDQHERVDENSGRSTGGKKLPENSKESLDRKLDEGIEETFPASDPVAVCITK
jgi:hypothetical protein